ncbi:MAG: SdpI family protein [Clostridia bacterium]|nr:SdpI family protein [Clostridia bacterium]
MTTTKILALIIMLVLPVCIALLGAKRMKANTEIGARGGYRSERSMVSSAAWTYAQKKNGVYYLIGGVIMAVLSVLLATILPETKTMVPLIVYALVFAAVWIVGVLVLMVITEMQLISKHFEKNA